MGRTRWAWIDDTFNERKVHFPDGTIWELGQQLSEASRQRNPPCEARAVYVSTQLTGSHVGMEAIIKVRMQIPDSESPHPDPAERAKDASEEWHGFTDDEISALEDLTAAGCSAAPKLLSWTQESQDDTMWVPGGYIVYILMEKLPGAPPWDFWVEERYSLEDRNEVREAFRAAYSEVKRCGIIPMDSRLTNILWDKESRRCYLVDFEDCIWLYSPEWNDAAYFLWGLAQTVTASEAKW